MNTTTAKDQIASAQKSKNEQLSTKHTRIGPELDTGYKEYLTATTANHPIKPKTAPTRKTFPTTDIKVIREAVIPYF